MARQVPAARAKAAYPAFLPLTRPISPRRPTPITRRPRHGTTFPTTSRLVDMARAGPPTGCAFVAGVPAPLCRGLLIGLHAQSFYCAVGFYAGRPDELLRPLAGIKPATALRGLAAACFASAAIRPAADRGGQPAWICGLNAGSRARALAAACCARGGAEGVASLQPDPRRGRARWVLDGHPGHRANGFDVQSAVPARGSPVARKG